MLFEAFVTSDRVYNSRGDAVKLADLRGSALADIPVEFEVWWTIVGRMRPIILCSFDTVFTKSMIEYGKVVIIAYAGASEEWVLHRSQ